DHESLYQSKSLKTTENQLVDLIQITNSAIHSDYSPDILLGIISEAQTTTINQLLKVVQRKYTPTTLIPHKIDKAIYKDIWIPRCQNAANHNTTTLISQNPPIITSNPVTNTGEQKIKVKETSKRKLPEEYFANLDLLPTNLANLHLAVRDLFLITDRKCLKDLGKYRRKLSQYYEVKTISPNYFDLPPPKTRLPLAY
ncbi:11339_t:CDS:2, partial [Ambispora leptoticha]